MAYDADHDGRRDFDFLFGRWTVAHRRLEAGGVGCETWKRFAGTSTCRSVMGGLCNIEENVFEGLGEGVAFRTFDIAAGRWSIHWVASRDGVMQPPVHGGFSDGVGLFEGDDVDGGRPVKVVFRWDEITPVSARWSQAFSYDGGESWETNWVMEFRRVHT